MTPVWVKFLLLYSYLRYPSLQGPKQHLSIDLVSPLSAVHVYKYHNEEELNWWRNSNPWLTFKILFSDVKLIDILNPKCNLNRLCLKIHDVLVAYCCPRCYCSQSYFLLCILSCSQGNFLLTICMFLLSTITLVHIVPIVSVSEHPSEQRRHRQVAQKTRPQWGWRSWFQVRFRFHCICSDKF